MFKNNIKTALRDLLKNKGFAFLNIFGLALGQQFDYSFMDEDFDAANQDEQRMMIAFITISFQSIRAAGVNPVASLRSE